MLDLSLQIERLRNEVVKLNRAQLQGKFQSEDLLFPVSLHWNCLEWLIRKEDDEDDKGRKEPRIIMERQEQWR